MKIQRSKTKKKIDNGKAKRIFLLVILGLVIGFFVYYATVLYTTKLFDPTKANGSHQYLLSKTASDTEKTLIVIESGEGADAKISSAYVFMYNKTKSESMVIYVPGWMYFAGLEENFGNSVSVSSFKYAGEFLQEGRGVEYAIWQISQMLGIKFDNYIWFNSEGIKNFEQVYGKFDGVEDKYREYYKLVEGDTLNEDFFRLQVMASDYSALKSIFKISSLTRFNDGIYSNIGFTNVLTFFEHLNSKIKGTETYGIDLSFYRYTTEDLSSSGGQIRYINTTEFDTTYRQLIAKIIDRSLEKERVRIEVYNGSGVAGAAKQFGRKIENAGCDVVRYENAPDTIERTVVYAPNEEGFAKSLEITSEVLSGSYDLRDGRPEFMTTGDIVIILGEDIKQMYSF